MVYFDWHPAETPNNINQDFENPIIKNISYPEKDEEYNTILNERSISTRNGDLLTRSYQHSIGFLNDFQ
jgi:hypothetical protein